MKKTKMHLSLIQDGAHDGTFNMQADEFLFQSRIRERNPSPVLRFYRFSSPCFTIGYGLWRTFHRFEGSMIRRLTGGGIVRHGDDLTYSIVTPVSRHRSLKKAEESYLAIHEALAAVLMKFGIPVALFQAKRGPGDGNFCFDSPVLHDIMLGDKKAAGGAQKRSHGYLLHQGSIWWPHLMSFKSGLSEISFREEFARQLARWFQLPVKKQTAASAIPVPEGDRYDLSGSRR